MTSIRAAVRDFVIDRFWGDDESAALTDDLDLNECGVLGSLAALELVAFIEDRFQVRLEAVDLESGNLFTVTGIEKLVLLRGASAAGLTQASPNIGTTATSRQAGERCDSDQQISGAPQGLYEYFHEVASNNSSNVAVVDDGKRLTYADLLARVDEFADALLAAGVKPLDRVAVILGNGCGFVIALLAAWRLGAVVIPLNPQLQGEEFSKYFLDSRPSTLITSPRHSTLSSLMCAKGAPLEHAWIHLRTADEWLYESACEQPRGQDNAIARIVELQPTGAALTQYSTGTTGAPKRVTRTHEQLLTEFFSYSSVFRPSAGDRVIGALPFYHSHGLKNAAMLALFSGASLYALESFFPRDVARLIVEERMTIYPGAPLMFRHLAELPERYDFSSLHLVFSGSAPLPKATALAFQATYGMGIRTVYGTTETGLVCIQREPGEIDETNRVGVPIPGVSVQIVDEQGAPVLEGVEGRVKIVSPYAACRYDNSEGSEESYFEAGSLFPGYFPGDIGWMTAAGELVLSGRHRGFINVGGNKVNPAEVEAALLEVQGVEEAVVFGIPDASSGERVKAIIETSKDVSKQAVRGHLMQRLAQFKHPRTIEISKDLPRSPLGKILRNKVIEQFSRR